MMCPKKCLTLIQFTLVFFPILIHHKLSYLRIKDLFEATETMIVADMAVHQPHFLPWLPYMARIASVKHFVILDDVYYKKNYFQNRTRIRSQNGTDIWWTIPVVSSPRTQIRYTQTSSNLSYNLGKIIKGLELNYSKAPFASQYLAESLNFFYGLQKHPPKTILELSIQSIYFTFELLKISPPKIITSSSIQICNKDRGERILELSRVLKAKTMLNGWGGSKNPDVHDLTLIDNAGLKMVYFRQESFTESPMWKDIQNGVTTIHTLMYHGPDRVLELIDSSCNMHDQYEAKI